MSDIGSKRYQGRGEEIIDPHIPIIDAHHHLFDFPNYRYLLDDYLEDARQGHDIVASVYIEIQSFARQHGPEWLRPLGEIEFANGMGAMCAQGQYGPRVAAAIIGHADLRWGEKVGEFLDRALERAPDRFRGIRQITIEHPDEIVYRYITHRPPAGVMQHPDFDTGFAQLARRGLIFEAAVFHNQLPDLQRLARRYPETPIVLSHLGLAMGLGTDAAGRRAVFEDWRAKLRDLATCENVYCKIGGLGLPFWGFGHDERDDVIGSEELAACWGPYVEAAIEAFGPGRCLMRATTRRTRAPAASCRCGTRSSASCAAMARAKRPPCSVARRRGSTALRWRQGRHSPAHPRAACPRPSLRS